jgi:hypothetical protein
MKRNQNIVGIKEIKGHKLSSNYLKKFNDIKQSFPIRQYKTYELHFFLHHKTYSLKLIPLGCNVFLRCEPQVGSN